MKAILLLGCAIAILPAPTRAQTVDDRARAAASASRAKTGDSDTLLNNYVTPGLAGQSVSTIDNSKSFNPNIACQKTSTMIELLAQPSGTGDIGTLRISRDKDLDGTFDQTLTLPVPVSGICANGVISCEPGTWNQCRDFKWDVATGGDLKLTEVDQTELAGCYCINNSCGSNLAWGNLSSVLKDLGGGVVGALTTADPRLGVAQATIDGPVIRYTGAQTTACADSSTIAQTSYRSNPASISSDAYAASQSSSVFQMLAGSPAGAGQSEEARDCTIKRDVTLTEVRSEDVIERTSGGYATYTDAGGSVSFVMGSPADNSLTGNGCSLIDFRMKLHVTDATRLTSIRLASYFADDWAQVRIDGELVASGPQTWTGTGVPPGKCEKNGTFYAYPNLDLKSAFTNGDHEVWLRVAVADGGEAYAVVQATVDTSCAVSERLIDACQGNAADSQCHLENETVDGVETFRNGVGTGLKPLAQTRLFTNGSCSYQITRDFFERDRRYKCTSNSPEIDLSRGAYIIDHSTETLLADRTTASDGTVSTSTRAFSIPDRGSVSACEAICKTRAPKANTDAALSGVVGTSQNDPTGWDTFYHSCQTNSSGADVCPLGSGEEIVSDCGCLDDFPEAVVMMQTVRLAGSDLVCTSEAR